MSVKTNPSLQHHTDGLDIRLKETISLYNSIQNMKDVKIFYNHEAKKYT